MDRICKACSEEYCPDGVQRPEDCNIWRSRKNKERHVKIKKEVAKK